MARPAAAIEITMDRQGRLVVPRQLRDRLGAAPAIVLASPVDGGVLLEPAAPGGVVIVEDGLPVLSVERAVTNDEVLAALDAERSDR